MAGAHALSLGRAGTLPAKPGLNVVEVLDLSQEPATELGFVVFGFVKFAPDVRPAADELDVGVLVAVGFIGLVAIALEDAAKALSGVL